MIQVISPLKGFAIEAVDERIGTVVDFLFDEDCSLVYFIVNTRNWWLGKRVLMASNAVAGIEWSVERVHFDATREKIKAAPVWDPLVAFSETYRTHLHKHHGWLGSSA